METAISDKILGFNFKYCIYDDLAITSVAIKKEWETHITNFTQLYNDFYKIKNIIDIGANFGYHSLLFSRLCSEKVYSFEPQIQNFGLLEDNIKINKIENVILFNLACGEEYCQIKMPIFVYNNNNINMGDITPNIDIDEINNNFSITMSVPLDKIYFSSNIDLIKLDVQGWEKKVLLGATKLLKSHKPILIVEFEEVQLSKTNTTSKELFDFIREQEYYIFYLEQKIYQCDHVCVHKEKLEDFRLNFKNYIFPHTENNHLNNNFIHGVIEKLVVM